MLVFSFWVVGLVLIIAQTTLLEYLPFWLGRPDMLFVLVTFIAYRFAWIPGIILVFVLSWVLDVVASVYLGIYPLVCLLVFTALKTLTDKSPVKEFTYQVPLVGVSYLSMQIFLYVINAGLLPDLLPDWSWAEALQRTVLVTLSAIPLFVLFNRLYEFILKRRLRSTAPRRRSQRI